MSNERIEAIRENRGLDCLNCGAWRSLLRDDFGIWREIEACPTCSDAAFDIYQFVKEDPFLQGGDEFHLADRQESACGKITNCLK